MAATSREMANAVRSGERVSSLEARRHGGECGDAHGP